MITVMRKHHKVLMIIITALVCISFSWFYNRTDFSSISNGAVGKLYDHTVSELEFQRYSRLLRLASQLGMRDLVQNLTAGAQSETDAFDNFAWNLMILRHETDRFGLRPTTEEIANEVKSLPAFNDGKGFDLAAYSNFVDHALGPMGFTESQIEELAADQIALGRLKKILNAGISMPEAEMRKNYDQAYAKLDVAVVRFQPENFSAGVEVSDDQIAKYYDAHKAELKSDEKRQVKIASFGLTEEQKKLSGKARIDALQAMADKANDFSDALQAKSADLAEVAAKFQIKLQETSAFSQEKPDPLLQDKPQLTAAAFALTKENPNSEPIQSADGFDILHLVKVEPSHPMTKEEARPKIVETLTKLATQQKIAAKAQEVVNEMRTAMKNGKTVQQAAEQAGVKAEKLPTFSLAEQPPGATPPPKPEPKNEAPDMGFIKQTASTLKSGEVSDYVNTSKGGLIVVMEKRAEPTTAEFEQARPALEKNVLTNRGDVVFYEWLRNRRQTDAVIETAKAKQPVPG